MENNAATPVKAVDLIRDETFMSGVTYDNQSLIFLTAVDIHEDEDYDTNISNGCDDPQEVSLASKDVLSFQSRRRHEQLPEQDQFLEHTLPSSYNIAWKRRRKILGLASCLVLLIVAVALSVALTNRKAETDAGVENKKLIGVVEKETEITNSPTGIPDPTDMPTPAPTKEAQNSLEYEIISPKVEDPQLMLNPSTPQGMAFQQILSEGRTDAFRILQRFALMVIHFSTGGENWDFKHGWQGFEEDECQWMGITTCRMQSHGSLAGK